MPGLITHLEIANNIGKKLKTGIIKNRALFYIGSIAPDAVHSKEDYQRIHKKKSHLRQEIADVDFNNISNLDNSKLNMSKDQNIIQLEFEK